jgi:hypothetical protein
MRNIFPNEIVENLKRAADWYKGLRSRLNSRSMNKLKGKNANSKTARKLSVLYTILRYKVFAKLEMRTMFPHLFLF